MSIINGSKNIQIVQGDTYILEVAFENAEISLIEAIYFTCDKLSVCKKLEYNDDDRFFYLTLESNETKQFPKGTYNYDLTINFLEDNVKTVQYKAIINILEKNNKVVCYE